MESLMSPSKQEYLAVGMMSGTSADGVDASLVRFKVRDDHIDFQLLEYLSAPYPKKLRNRIFQLFRDEKGSVKLLCELNFEIGEYFAKVAERLILASGFPKQGVSVIGSHGQTVYHLPPGQKEMGSYIPSTLQIGESTIIAQKMGIPVAADFRTADMAAGGNGAPLISIADYYLMSHGAKTRIIQNIGGIANCTLLIAGGGIDDILAFDTGPGNMVIDGVVFHLTEGKKKMDKNGKMAQKGSVDEKWLKTLLKNPYFNLKPPRTTGRELFGEQYARELIKQGRKRKLSDEDIVATVSMLTVHSIIDSYEKYCFPKAKPKEIILGGGGAKNKFLVNELKERIPAGIRLMTHENLGINSKAKESIGFAMLGLLAVLARPGNVPSATGAEKQVNLGKLYYP